MKQARLEVVGAPGAHPLPTDSAEFTIGRLKTNHLSLPGAEVSRVHAKITRDEEGRFTLRDCGSRFGTFVNDGRIAERVLADGDRIRLGEHSGPELVFLHQRDERTPEETATRTIGELRQIAALLEGLRALGTGRVLEDVLALVVDSAIEVAGAERGFIMLANENGVLEFTLARGRGGLTLPGSDFAASRKVPQDVFQTGLARVVRNLEGAPEHARTALLGIRAVVCVPLRVIRFLDAAAAPDTQERRIGVLYLDSRKETLLSSWVGSTVETLATEAAVAIENARLYRQSVENVRLQQELRIAAEIQRALFPKMMPAGQHFTASAATVPTRSIGGDFFDYLELPGGQVGFVLGDVAGKGPPAALLSALMQGMFAFASEGTRGPAGTIARLNRALFLRGVESRFVTLFHGALAEDGSLTYCNAGHNPALLFGRNRVRKLDVGGPIVGMLEDARFDEEAVRLAPGESVVVFSDGISEAHNAAGEEYGEDRILAVVQRHAGSVPQEMVDQLFVDVRQFCGPLPQRDDMTALVIQYL
jgi:sigma-B regulation protein RsbU (phosphoserine phosphatase)